MVFSPNTSSRADHEYPQKAPKIVMINHHVPSVAGFGHDIISYSKKHIHIQIYTVYIYIWKNIYTLGNNSHGTRLHGALEMIIFPCKNG